MNRLDTDVYINSKIVPIAKKGTYMKIPIAKIIRIGRRNVGKKTIEDLAVSTYRTNGRGITFSNLLVSGLASNDKNAKLILKYHRKKGTLFTLGKIKPQQYYPKCLRSDILKKKVPIDTTVPSNISPDLETKAKCLQDVLNSLQWFPLYIHKLQLMLKVDCHELLDADVLIECYPHNGFIVEKVGKASVKYKVHANGTIQVYVACSSFPYRIETEEDIFHLFGVLGQIHDRLLHILKDPHERFTPPIEEWELTECDISKDIPITDDYTSHLIPLLPLKIAGREFRLYAKSMNGVSVCRAEESVTMSNTPLGMALRSLRRGAI